MLLLSVFHQNHWPQRLVYRMGEVLHLCAIYFGIAALVTLFSLWLVPSTREQTEQIYASVIDTLRPAGWSLHQALVQGGELGTEPAPRAAALEGEDRKRAVYGRGRHPGRGHIISQTTDMT